ncbi:MAG: PIN domain-containing protein, partial [Chloroflexota bacterium]|nr:PIN domain-containing protein [Chloroflexota bacterium]
CPPQNTSSVEPYRDLVTQLLKENVEIAAIKCRLEERGYTGSYSAVRRFVRKIKPHTPEATVRVERKPGEEAQVDFGYAGRMIDPVTEALRRTWAFVMTLSWSRRKYAITDEDVEQLVTLLERDALLVSGDADVAGTIPEDPTDEMVLACAVDAQADVIVSGDRRLLDMDSYRSIPILTARQFLERLETDSPGSMPSTKSWW